MRPLLLLLTAGCAARIPAEVGAADADLALITSRLSARHPSDDCAALTAGLSDPAVGLRRAVEEADGPPWVSIIASRCLVRGWAEAEEAAITRWLGDPELAGVARVVVRELPALADEPLVIRLGRAALAGPERALAAETLRGDVRVAVRSSVE